MRVMVLVKASKDSEAGVMPSEDLFTQMGAYNEELVKAGVMLAMDGLHPSSKGLRMRFSGSQRTLTDGPFAETKELLAGFWIWQVRSFDEAVEWLKRAPFDGGTEIELRPIFEMEDFRRGADAGIARAGRAPARRDGEARRLTDQKARISHSIRRGARRGLHRSNSTEKTDAFHGDGQGDQGQRSRRGADPRAGRCDDGLQ
ncbi:YciI family protein [Bosea vestrisii]|uniref:YciI family protein n=1 Tax=Bosea vestrisii TaxID=151416 RepID=UPI00326419DF